MTTPDVFVSLKESALEAVVDLYAGGLIHTLDTPLQVAYAEAPYGDTASYLQSFVAYHEDMLEAYTVLAHYYSQQRVLADVASTMQTLDRTEESLDQLPETD